MTKCQYKSTIFRDIIRCTQC